ncbi:MAG: type I DNA topoisomerase [Bacteroidales bacterium]|nr:type I DNA topoisomerase [Bacteroidales bacterium]
MTKNLVIVESPAKAKTIEGFLGKEYVVKSSYGHVMDLSKTQLGVDIGKGFEPQYEVSPDKKKLIAELKQMAKGAETIWLASDEDREGEAISYHLFKALGLKESQTKRIVFHEITKSAITKAIETPRGIDHNLVAAQQARRVLDRLVGYELSPLLWKKVKPSLSAGRVQSVAVRLIVEREEEIKEFSVSSAFRVVAHFELVVNGITYEVEAELPERFETRDAAFAFLESCKGASFTVQSVEKKPAKKSPAPPFTTSTLQQEASRKLGYSVANTMRVAQHLYESGKITYMRTDSVNLAESAIQKAKAVVTETYGANYVKSRRYATKTKGAQEAHEAIRPTYLENQTISGSDEEKRLYDLIWKRTIASQMADAELERTNVQISISTNKRNLVASGEVILFDGFLKVYFEGTDDDSNEEKQGILPPLQKGQDLKMNQMIAQERFTRHPARYTEASLVKKMEELGIGRPSTYAPTISTIQKREYVVKEDRPGMVRKYQVITLKADQKIIEKTASENTGFEKAKLFPTDIGILVNRFLCQYFNDIIDYNFTANVEKEFDEIAEGRKKWNQMIGEFYGPFHAKIEDTLENAAKFSGEKLLGVDQVSGKNVYVKVGRYGPIVQLGDTESDEKPRFAGLRKNQAMDTISLDEAMDLFSFPRLLGEYEGKEMSVAIGRFGPYVKHNNQFFSLMKTDDPGEISVERAIELIEAKRNKAEQSIIKEFAGQPDLKVLNGRYGPYITFNKKNFKIPKGTDPGSLTLEACMAIVDDPANAPKKKFVRKKK